MIRNFHVHYVAHPTFQDQEVHSGSHCSSQQSQMFVWKEKYQSSGEGLYIWDSHEKCCNSIYSILRAFVILFAIMVLVPFEEGGRP